MKRMLKKMLSEKGYNDIKISKRYNEFIIYFYDKNIEIIIDNILSKELIDLYITNITSISEKRFVLSLNVWQL